MMKAKVALVLGSGGARGLAHIGVLKVLEKNNIPIHLIVGTSIGAFVGGFYAAGTGVDLMEKVALSVNKKFVAKMLAPGLPKSGLVNIDRIRSYLREFLGDLEIEQLRIPFASVATDLTTGEEVIHDSGPLVEAIIASIAIPGLFRPVHYQNRYLVDGGLVNPLPVSIAYKMGADLIIAVNVTPAPSKIWKPKESKGVFRLNRTVATLRELILNENKRSRKKSSAPLSTELEPPHWLQILMQSITIVETRLQTLHLAQWPAHVLISPVIEGFNVLEFYRANELIDSGEKAANIALSQIRSLIQNSNKDI
jgi:NTE family protein